MFLPFLFGSKSCKAAIPSVKHLMENWVFVIHSVISVISSREISSVHIMEYGYLSPTLSVCLEMVKFVGNSPFTILFEDFLCDGSALRNTSKPPDFSHQRNLQENCESFD